MVQISPKALHYSLILVSASTTSISGLLWSGKLIFSFWVPNGSIRIKLGDDIVKLATHKADLKLIFAGNPILMDREQDFIFGTIFCSLDVFKLRYIIFFF